MQGMRVQFVHPLLEEKLYIDPESSMTVTEWASKLADLAIAFGCMRSKPA